MTDEQQITEIAKLDGVMLGGMVELPTHPTEMVKEKSPEYLISFDVILPVVRKQPIEIQRKFYALLPNKPWVDLTVPEIARTLLRATGKWQDEPKERKV